MREGRVGRQGWVVRRADLGGAADSSQASIISKGNGNIIKVTEQYVPWYNIHRSRYK